MTTLMEVMHRDSVTTINKLFHTKILNRKAAYSIEKVTQLITRYAPIMEIVYAAARESWQDYPLLVAEYEDLSKSDKEEDHLRMAEIDKLVNTYLDKELRKRTAASRVDQKISPLKLSLLKKLGLTSAEIASINWFVINDEEV